MSDNDLASRVIAAVQGKPEAIKEISAALASGDAGTIKEAISKHAGIEISIDEAQTIAGQVQGNPSQASAYVT